MDRFPKTFSATIPKYKEDKCMYMPLHIHSSYSLNDSVTRVKDIPEVARQLGMKAITISDHGTMSGTFLFAQECKKRAIKPVIGCEFYVNSSRKSSAKNTKNQHLCLFAMNETGYRNMLDILYDSLTEGFYYRGRTDLEFIAERNEGIICTTACMGSPIIMPMLEEKPKIAIENLKLLKEAFGDRLYIEIQFNELEIQKQIVDWLLTLSERFGIKSVYGLDSHYTYPDDVHVHDILKLYNRKATVRDPDFREHLFSARHLYIKPFSDALKEPKILGYKVTESRVQSLLETTNEIANRVNFEFEFKLSSPAFKWKGQPVNAEKFLKLQLGKSFAKKCKNGIIPSSIREQYRKRMEYEYQKILDCGYPNFFLILWDMCRVCMNKGIYKGAGRGSAAGSLVSFLLDISSVDPIKHGLLFERFMDVERKDPPDVDLDWESERKPEIEEYLKNKYGKERVAHVVTFNYWGTKSAMSEIFKILGEDVGTCQSMTRWIRFNEMDNRDAQEIDAAIKFLEENCADKSVLNLIRRQENVGIPLAKRLVDNIRHVGLHSGGVVITPECLSKYMPVVRHKGSIVTGFTQGSDVRTELEKLGLIKIDILGVNAVSIVKAIIRMVKERHGVDLTDSIWQVDVEEPKVYEYYQKGYTEGIFQVESEKINEFIRKLRPEHFSDLCAVIALYRPGGLQTGESERFIKRKNGKEEITYVHPSLEKYIGDTYGCFVYQEQLMQIMLELAGFSRGEVLKNMKLLKVAYDPKDERVLELIKRLKKDLICIGKFTEKQSEELTETMRKCYAYIFNKSHSTAYALFSYIMMWLKVHYPIEFFCGLLSQTENTKTEHKGGETKIKLKRYIDGASKLGIKVFPPEFNKSHFDFRIVGNETIISGNRIIVGIGTSANELDKVERGSSFEDFVCNKNISWQKLNKSKVEKLIKIGFFDGKVGAHRHITRKQLVYAWQLFKRRKVKEIKNKELAIIEDLKTATKEVKGEFSKHILLGFQLEMFRFFFTEHPLESRELLRLVWEYNKSQQKKSRKIQRVSMLNKQKLSTGTIIGYITNQRVTSPKKGISKGEKMAIITIEDKEDKARVLIWPEYYMIPKYKELIKEGQVVIMRVRRKNSEIDDFYTYELQDSFSSGALIVSPEDLGRIIKKEK